MFNKATVFSILGSAGVVVTSVLSVKCYKKIKETDDTKTKTKKYAPAVLSGGISIGCILIADKINKKEIAAATASALYFAKKFIDYEKEVREIVGDETADEIEKSFYSKQLDKQIGDKELDENTFKFIDKYSGASIIAPYDKVVQGLEKCKETYNEQGYFCWCDIFYLINKSFDLYDTSIGESIGWSRDMFRELYDDEDIELKFGLKELGDNKYLIDYNYLPEWMYMDY